MNDKTNHELPVPEKENLNLGYLRLTDAAPLIVAQELGLFTQMGMSVSLHQEISWANARDKLAAGNLDAAQMLAPLPAMSTLGVSGIRAPILTGLVLSKNGNAITLSQPLWAECQSLRDRGECASIAEALALVMKTRNLSFTFATVHAFSTHTVLLRRWLRTAGIDPDRDIRLIVVPPVQMVDSLRSGVIDGYCVGEPWNTVAVIGGLGGIAAMGVDVWSGAPEKVLAVSEEWHRVHPNTHLRLRVALLRACAWLACRENATSASRMLAAPEYLNIPASRILPSLTGCLRDHATSASTGVPNFHLFYGDEVNRPQLAETVSLINECAELTGKPVADTQTLAEQVCRPDLYDATLPHLKAFASPAAPK